MSLKLKSFERFSIWNFEKLFINIYLNNNCNRSHFTIWNFEEKNHLWHSAHTYRHFWFVTVYNLEFCKKWFAISIDYLRSLWKQVLLIELEAYLFVRNWSKCGIMSSLDYIWGFYPLYNLSLYQLKNIFYPIVMRTYWYLKKT